MTPWVRRFLTANVAVFLVSPPPLGVLGLLPAEVVDQMILVPAEALTHPWTVVTYQFLHVGILHLAFNMMGLFFFGPRLEARIGSNHFAALYLLSGASGAVLSVFTPNVPIVGASGAVLGVVLGFARYWPHERVLLMAIIPMEVRVLVIFFAGASLFLGVLGTGNIAHFAHLGGFAGAWLYLRAMEARSPARRFKKRAEAAVPAKPGTKDLRRWEGVDVDTLHPLNREEYERVLEKARAQGPPALTVSERAFLERFAGGG